MQIHCSFGCLGRTNSQHVRFHVPNAKDYIRDGARWTYFQVGGVETQKSTPHQLIITPYRFFSQVWISTGTPALATFVSGLAAGLAALVIRLEILVEMMSIGKLIHCHANHF